ncbi:MAG: DUF192 domain-containing protein [Syntrophomonas sp.]
MKKIMVLNMENGELIINQGKLANTFASRLIGLMGKKKIVPGEGLMLYPCDMIHSVGMKIEIDVLFVSKEDRVVHIIERMPHNRISPRVKNARYVLELAAGQIAETGTIKGHKLEIILDEQVGSKHL